MRIVNAYLLIFGLGIGTTGVGMDNHRDRQTTSDQRKDSLKQQILHTRDAYKQQRRSERKNVYPYDLNRSFEVKRPAKRCTPDS